MSVLIFAFGAVALLQLMPLPATDGGHILRGLMNEIAGEPLLGVKICALYGVSSTRS